MTCHTSHRPLSASRLLIVFSCVWLFATSAHAASEPVNSKPVNPAQAQVMLKNENAAKPIAQSLSDANAALNKKNALLQQENTALMTQVNVLTAERSNQLFMTGAFVAFGGIFLGFIAAWLLVGRRQNNW